jgi:hypothetical protein
MNWAMDTRSSRAILRIQTMVTELRECRATISAVSPDSWDSMRGIGVVIGCALVLPIGACHAERQGTAVASDAGVGQVHPIVPEWLTNPPRCSNDSDCPPGLKCAPLMASMGCLVPCKSDKDCPADWVCCCRDAGCTYRSCADPPPGFCDPPPRPVP